MIEIEFRGQPIGKRGVWQHGIGAYKTNTAEHLVINAKGDSVEVVHLCRYTGLKDKNRKKIYEGDILADLKGRIIGVVQGGVRGYCYDVVYPRPIRGETDWSLYGIVVNDYGGKVVVAGNIYENPELIKGGK